MYCPVNKLLKVGNVHGALEFIFFKELLLEKNLFELVKYFVNSAPKPSKIRINTNFFFSFFFIKKVFKTVSLPFVVISIFFLFLVSILKKFKELLVATRLKFFFIYFVIKVFFIFIVIYDYYFKNIFV